MPLLRQEGLFARPDRIHEDFYEASALVSVYTTGDRLTRYPDSSSSPPLTDTGIDKNIIEIGRTSVVIDNKQISKPNGPLSLLLRPI